MNKVRSCHKQCEMVPKNRPQGRQCVTHRRPQNLCGKRVPKTVPMKAHIVETVADKHPIFIVILFAVSQTSLKEP